MSLHRYTDLASYTRYTFRHTLLLSLHYPRCRIPTTVRFHSWNRKWDPPHPSVTFRKSFLYYSMLKVNYPSELNNTTSHWLTLSSGTWINRFVDTTITTITVNLTIPIYVCIMSYPHILCTATENSYLWYYEWPCTIGKSVTTNLTWLQTKK